MLAQNDNTLTEKQMLEDKKQFTDWEATNEVIEEQVRRERKQWKAVFGIRILYFFSPDPDPKLCCLKSRLKCTYCLH